MKYALFAVLYSASGFAQSGCQLDLYVYSSASGHGLGPETYIGEFRLPAQTPEDCDKIGEQALKYFKSGHLPDGSVSLAGFSCEAAP